MNEHNERATISIATAPNRGGNTLATAISRLLTANNIAHERNGKTIEVNTSPGIQHLLAYDFPANPLSQAECTDEEGKFRDPRANAAV